MRHPKPFEPIFERFGMPHVITGAISTTTSNKELAHASGSERDKRRPIAHLWKHVLSFL
jgi:hypothetical protein